MKRLIILGAALVATACAQEPPPPAAPAPPAVAVVPPPPAAPLAPALASFDGRYAGMMTVGVSGVNDTATYPICSNRRVNMTIQNGYATISYQDWRQQTLHYRGQIDPAGTINMSHLNGDGSRSIFTLKISGTGANGQMQRGDCWYNVSMTRA
jgi:hypothetical protein